MKLRRRLEKEREVTEKQEKKSQGKEKCNQKQE